MVKSHREYALPLLIETREDLARADGKVSALLSAAGIIGSIIVGAIAAGHWRPSQLALWAQGTWWFGVAMASAGFVALAMALAPRTRHPEDKSTVRYFGHAAQFDSIEEFDHALGEAKDDGASRTVSQLWLLSRVLVRKYELIRFSLVSFGLAAVLLIVAATGG